MNYSLTIFKNMYDVKTHRRMDFETWEDFVKLLRSLSSKRVKSKRDAELISPAVYEEGTTRKNVNVLHWAGWAAIDVDTIENATDIEAYVREKVGQYTYAVYSTASSRSDTPKFRVVFPLTNEVKPKDIKAFWYALTTEAGFEADAQCKDYSRMYYIPAKYDDANNFFFVNQGKPIDPISLMKKHRFVDRSPTGIMDRLPPEMRKAVMKHRQNQMTNLDVEWSSYKNCEFVNKKKLAEYDAIAYTDGSGRYKMIYDIMVGIATSAINKRYPITADDIVRLIREIDAERSNLYKNRPLKKEAQRAISYAYSVASL